MLAKTFGCCRFLYNTMLSDKIEAYKKTGKSLRTLPASYKSTYKWLKEVDSLALANVQLHLEAAYRNFFTRPETGFPKYKSKHRNIASYTTNMVNGNIKLDEKHIRLPKIGNVRIKLHRSMEEGSRMKSVTVTMEPSGKYYVSILAEYEAEESQTAPYEWKEILGIDYAMKGMAVFSDGTRAEYPEYYRKAQAKLAREQRKLSKCEKGSKNRDKQRRKVVRCHEKIRNQRKDFQEKLSKRLAEKYSAAAVEDLDLKKMSGEHDLGKGIMDNGYGMFLKKLAYKLEDRGGKLVKVGRFYPSSKTCSCCGRIKQELKLSDRIYVCECGNRMDRDINAAINIREEGKRILEAV